MPVATASVNVCYLGAFLAHDEENRVTNGTRNGQESQNWTLSKSAIGRRPPVRARRRTATQRVP